MSSPSDELATFPPGFLWGASTAAYQIEGAAAVDGRGPSVWDTFSHQPGRIADGSTGDVACDHYHRCAEDVALMSRLGLTGYRFSVAWPRIQPAGSGPVNQAGLAFYDRLIDALLARDIAPMLTLFHWDLPQPLQDAGGWLNRDTTARFAEYAAILGERFADRVGYWMPVNEPNVVTLLGHVLGVHAPGSTLGWDALPVAHHLLLGHGLAVQALRAAGARRVGSANNHVPVWPASESAADLAAAAGYDDVWNRLFADPILLGSYPERLLPKLPAELLRRLPEDLATIAQPLDFYGLNHYNPARVGAATGGESAMERLGFRQVPLEGYPRTDFDWPVVPAGLREVLNQLAQRYPGLPPVIVTENGCSYADGPGPDGLVHDDRRIAYLDGHLRAVRQAMTDGVPVAGYCCWSLLDNFEWAEGYRQRFGLVHVDYQTQVRTPKDSYAWYAGIIRRNRGS
ncbi:MAG TPA: GH1 family beta-glucosidase [Jatrophihabitans sp.]|nr:GH1 family beta-glucosidase [Jatrophihabitans sp.]